MSFEYGHYIPPDPNITHFSTGHHVQRVTVNEKFLMIEDPMLGDFIVGDRRDNGLYYDYLTTANASRSGGISQLCKDQATSTIPNNASLTRRWHVNGLVGMVDHIADRLEVDDVTRLGYHLATSGDDQAHAEFSHGVEQVLQSWGGPENFHEDMWPLIAELGGTADVLRKHGVTFDQNILIPGIELPGWINAKHPDVSADRLQYAVTELLLWFDHDGAPADIRECVRSICSMDNIVITDDGDMAFKDTDTARRFSKGYLLLTTEHWNEPINRVQLHLIVQAVQRAIVKRRISWMDQIDRCETRQPVSYMYGIDQDIVDAMHTGPGNTDDFMYAIRSALYPIAMQERKTFVDYKMREYAAFLLDDKARDYPSQYMEPKRVEFGPPASQVAITLSPALPDQQPEKLPQLDRNAEGIRYMLRPLKNRFVDPLVMRPGGLVRLSELDPNYKKLLAEQQQLQRMNTTVELAFAGAFEDVFKEGVRENEADFDGLTERSDMTDDQKRKIIEISAARADRIAINAGTLVLKNAA